MINAQWIQLLQNSKNLCLHHTYHCWFITIWLWLFLPHFPWVLYTLLLRPLFTYTWHNILRIYVCEWRAFDVSSRRPCYLHQIHHVSKSHCHFTQKMCCWSCWISFPSLLLSSVPSQLIHRENLGVGCATFFFPYI